MWTQNGNEEGAIRELWSVCKPGILGMDDDVADRLDRIRIAGNGQVPGVVVAAESLNAGNGLRKKTTNCMEHDLKFFVGIHQPCDARHLESVCVSVSRLRRRRSNFEVGDWLLDSGAFTEVTKHGGFRWSPMEYCYQILRWSQCGNLLAAVSQDYMCELPALEKTGLTIADHQRLTLERYDEINSLLERWDCDTYLMPVLQGQVAAQYLRHLESYGERLGPNAWVGVGSVCKRQGNPNDIVVLLEAIKRERPDLRLHGFGVKDTALREPAIRDLLYSADSMAWSFAARYEGRNANCWREAKNYFDRIVAAG